MTQYFFDVTDLRKYLSHHTQLSGIQRVSVMTIARARQLLGAENVWFSYHDRKTNKYWTCPCPADPNTDLTQHGVLSTALNVEPSLRGLPGMAKYSRNPFKVWFHTHALDLRAKLGDRRAFQRYGTDLQTWRDARTTFKALKKSEHRLEEFKSVARSGDQLVLLDNAWQPKGLEQWLSYAKHDMGLDVTVLLHDLIPLVNPQYTTSSVSDRFRDWINMSTGFVTRYLANSESTAADLRAFLKSVDAVHDVGIVPLAQAPVIHSDKRRSVEHDQAWKEPAGSVPDYIQALTKTPFVLVVGTMEIRKNLWQLATVWDRLRKRPGHDLPKLVFAGRRGWLNDDFENLMKATGQLGGWVEIVNAPSDDVLSYLYQNCLFTVTASFYEGWGLPIGESLGYGKTAVVSRTSSMPEVGGDMVEYCDPHSLGSIEAACLRLIDDPQHRAELEERIAKAQLRSWDEVAHDMLKAIRAS